MPSSVHPKTLRRACCLTCRHLEESVKGIGTLHFNGRRVDVHVRELQNAENDEVISVNVSDRLCTREGERSDQQRSFVQCARSQQLSVVSTFERLNGVDVSQSSSETDWTTHKWGHCHIKVVGSQAVMDFVVCHMCISPCDTFSRSPFWPLPLGQLDGAHPASSIDNCCAYASQPVVTGAEPWLLHLVTRPLVMGEYPLSILSSRSALPSLLS